MRTRLLTLITALTLALGVTTAKAEIITAWNYEVDGIFVSWTDDNNRTGSYNNNPTGIQGRYGAVTLDYDYYQGAYAPGSKTGYRTLRWGDSAGYSSLTLSPVDGAVYTDGAAVNGITFSHSNLPISASAASLRSGSILAALSMSPAGGSIDATTYSTTLEFFFFETTNGNSATERDILLVRNPYVATESFTHAGVRYDFTFEASFQLLTGWYADYARTQLGWSSDTPVYGWTTAEGFTTDFFTKLQVRHETMPPPATPEPATLALLGLGLAGLGLAARRRRSAK